MKPEWYPKEFFDKNFDYALHSTAEPWHYIKKTMNHDGPRPRILDVGCGSGHLVAWLRKKGFPAVGMDFSPHAGRLIKDYFVLHDATIKFPFDDNSFDMVIATDFFEHLQEKDIDFVADEMRRVAPIRMVRIGHKPERLLVNGIQTHLTIKPRLWWQEKLPDFILM